MELTCPNQITAIQYINMSANAHRRSLVKNLLEQFPYPYTRIPGIVFDWDEPRFQKYLTAGLEPYLQDHIHQKGIIGCWIAHTQALEAIPPDHSGITVVLEDDFICTPGFFESVLQCITQFGRAYDVFICDPWGKGPLQEHRVAENIYQPKNCNYPYYGGAHCLLINNQSVPKLLKLIERKPVKDYDGFLIDNEELNCFLIYTGLCGVRDVSSDIRG